MLMSSVASSQSTWRLKPKQHQVHFVGSRTEIITTSVTHNLLTIETRFGRKVLRCFMGRSMSELNRESEIILKA